MDGEILSIVVRWVNVVAVHVCVDARSQYGEVAAAGRHVIMAERSAEKTLSHKYF